MKLLKNFLDFLCSTWKCQGGFWVPLAIGAGVGLAKHEFIDKPRAKRMAAAEAEKTRWSPWTGMQGQTIMPPSAADAALKWGTTGALLGMQNPGAFGGGGAAKASPNMAYNYQPQGQQPMWGGMQRQSMYA